MHFKTTPLYFTSKPKQENAKLFEPEKSVLNNILNYSKSIEVKKTENEKSILISLN